MYVGPKLPTTSGQPHFESGGCSVLFLMAGFSATQPASPAGQTLCPAECVRFPNPPLTVFPFYVPLLSSCPVPSTCHVPVLSPVLSNVLSCPVTQSCLVTCPVQCPFNQSCPVTCPCPVTLCPCHPLLYKLYCTNEIQVLSLSISQPEQLLVLLSPVLLTTREGPFS
jgi:hypothetical protein